MRILTLRSTHATPAVIVRYSITEEIYMTHRLLRGLQLFACIAIGSAGMLAFSPNKAEAKNPCPNIVCTLDLPNLDLSCTYQAETSCSMSSPTSCQPGRC